MKVKLTRSTVINGSVQWAGATLEVDQPTAEHLEQNQMGSRLDSEWPTVQLPGQQPALKDILVFTPVYELEEQTRRALFQLRWDKPLTYLLQKDNPTGNGRQDILHQYQRGRSMFLAGSYDAMLVIEDDIVPPPTALQDLAALNSDVAYGVYRFRVSNVINVFERYDHGDQDGDPPRNMGESLSIKPALLRHALQLGKIPCSGGGLGCVLIRRQVLEQIPFRMELTAHCDSYFNRDVLAAGFSQWADMTVICGHVQEGQVLWPDLGHS
jgi:hypothetical protein